MDSLAIVIPLYNESACLPGLIKELLMSKTSVIKMIGIIPFAWGVILTWIGYYL